MTFLKDSLITLTILVISIRVMQATSTDDLKILRGYCRDIFITIGFKDNSGDFEKLKNTAGETLNNEDYNRLEDVKGDHEKIDSTGKTSDYKKLVEIYIKMIELCPASGKLGKKMKQSESELGNIYKKMQQSEVINKTNEKMKMIKLVPENEVTKEDIEKIKNVTTKFETDFKKFLQEKSKNDEPVTAFCKSKIKKNNIYLMAKFE